MKKLAFILTIIAALLAITGCAHVRESSATSHLKKQFAVALPPGWSVVAQDFTNSPDNNSVKQVYFAYAGTNRTGWFSPRPRIYLSSVEEWVDKSSGGGTFVFTDPNASQAVFNHSNQTALGGGRGTSIGQISSTITSNAVSAIGAVGTAGGNIIGAAAKAATGTP